MDPFESLRLEEAEILKRRAETSGELFERINDDLLAVRRKIADEMRRGWEALTQLRASLD